MEYKVSDFKLSHDELVNFLSDLTYGNNYVGIKLPDESKYKAKTYEDSIANCLEAGESIEFVDLAAEGSTENMSSIRNIDSFLSMETYSAFGCDNIDEFPVYKINLDDIYNGLCKIASLTAGEDAETLFCNFVDIFAYPGRGDMYDAWNIFQYIVFGEIVYN